MVIQEKLEGIVQTKPQEPSSNLKEILSWCDKIIENENITDP